MNGYVTNTARDTLADEDCRRVLKHRGGLRVEENELPPPRYKADRKKAEVPAY